MSEAWTGATVEELETFTGELSSAQWSNPGCRVLLEQIREEIQTRKPALSEVVKVGDFFECSWGYDQTNVNFYEVVAVTRATVKVVPVASGLVDESLNITHVAPLAGTTRDYDSFLPVDKPSTKRPTIYRSNGVWTCSIRLESFANGYLWDCKPAYETASGWGH